MLYGVGDLTFGDSSQILPHCTSSFTLTQSFESWGYNYLSSSKKMLVPAVDSFHAKQKQWTINLTAPMISEDLKRKLYYGVSSPEVLDKFVKIVVKPSEYIPIANASVISVIDVNTNEEVPVSYNSTSGIISFPPGFNDLVIIYLSEPAAGNPAGTLELANHIFSFKGILYNHASNQNLFLKADSVQISKYPEYSMSEQSITLDVLKEIKLYKI